jgi:hypothetical protein
VAITFLPPNYDPSLIENVVAEYGPFILTKTGVFATHEPEFEEWQEATEWCLRVQEASPFWAGDLVEYGESRFSEKFSQVLEATAYAVQTVRNAAVVARAIPPERRVAGVPFSHHAEVASLPPEQQDQLLARCENDGLTREKLRALVSQRKSEASGTQVEYTVVVTCSNADAQIALADRLRDEGFPVQMKNKTIDTPVTA